MRITSQEEAQRLDKYLNRYLSGAGTGFLYKMLRKKNITLNGKKAKGNESLRAGDVICLYLAEETIEKFCGSRATEFFPTSEKLKIVYEDENIIAVNKPSGMLSQKAGADDVSANEFLLGYLIESRKIRPEDFGVYRPGVCNRLDRNTSGLLLAAKTLPAARQLSALIASHELEKYYLTVVDGRLEESGHVTAYLQKDEKCNKVRVEKEPFEDGELIETAYEPLAYGRDVTFLKVRLITGRTHQIRSHLAYLGHPVVGDGKYGNGRINRYYRDVYGLNHQLLHAWKMKFPKVDGPLCQISELQIEAPLPELFSKILRQERLQVN